MRSEQDVRQANLGVRGVGGAERREELFGDERQMEPMMPAELRRLCTVRGDNVITLCVALRGGAAFLLVSDAESVLTIDASTGGVLEQVKYASEIGFPNVVSALAPLRSGMLLCSSYSASAPISVWVPWQRRFALLLLLGIGADIGLGALAEALY